MRSPLTLLTTFWPRRLLKGRSLRFAGLLVILMASLLLGWKALFATPDTSIGGTISTNTILGLTGTPGFQDTAFVVTSTLTVNPGVVLTIQPGVTLKFDSSAGLDVNGTLLALGVGSRIKFTRNGTSGNWQGIALTGLGADGSTLSKCDIEYAGNSSYGILFSDCSATMSDCTVTNSVTDGVRITGTSANPTLTSVTISNNGNHGVFVYTNGRGTLDGCTIQDNQYSGVYAYYNQGEAPTIQSGVISGNNILNAGGHGGVVVGALAMVSNNTIENNNQSGVRVENGNDLPTIQNNVIRNNTGYPISFAANPFTDAGTKITGNTFTGNTPNDRLEVFGGTLGVTATWAGTINGLGLDVTGNYTVGTGVTLTFNPGQTVFFGPSGFLQANSGIINAQGTVGSRIKFTRNGASGNWQGIGLYRSNSDSSVFRNCDIEFAGNASYGVSFSDSSASMSDCTVTNALYHGVGIGGTNANPTLTNVTISDSGYYGVYVHSTGHGTLSSCTIQNNQYSGVYAYSSQDESPSIQNCTISGNNIANYGGQGGVVVGALATVSNNTIENNNQSGVRVENGNDLPAIQNNIIRNNTSYPLSFAANPFTDAATKITGNTFTGNNPNDRLEVFGGTLGVNATWADTINGLGLDVTGTYTVGTGATLTFNPGQTVFFGPSGALQANPGIINAQGTVGSRIKFTRNGTSGNWQGIFLYGTSTNASVFSRCDIEYGGSSGYGGIEFYDSSATMNDCTVTNCVYNGVRLDGANANPTLTSVTISNNGQYGVVIYSNGQGTFSGCSIQNNQYSGVYAYSSQGEAPGIQNCTISGNNIANYGGHGGVVVGGLALLTGNTISNNQQSGLRVEGGTDLPTIQNNAFQNNTGYAISFAANPFTDAGTKVTGNTFTGNNPNNRVEVFGGTLSVNATWADTINGLGLDVTGTYAVGTGATLTFNPGQSVYFGPSGGLQANPGIINAQGTVGSRIKFTRSGTSGNWQGIFLYGTSTDASVFSRCDIEYGGSSGSAGVEFSDSSATMSDCTITNDLNYGVGIGGTSGNPTLTNVTSSNNGTYGVYVHSNGHGTLTGCTIQNNQYSGIYANYYGSEAPTVQNCTISGNNILNAGGHAGVVVGPLATVNNNTIENNTQSGVRVEGGTDLPTIQNNTIRNNTGHPISFAANPFTDAATKVTGNTFTGNTPNDRLEVFGGTLGVTATWAGTINGLGLDVTGSYTVGTGVTLTFNPGQTVYFGPSGGLQANPGIINAQGTAGSRIKFARNGTSGNWQGIGLYGSSSDSSVFRNCDIEFAGNSSYGIFFSDSSATMSDCTVTDNLYYGVGIGGATANPTLTNVTISNNGNYGVYVHSGGQGSFSGCTIQNNQYSGIYANYYGTEAPTVQNCTISGNNILNAGGNAGVVVGPLATVSNNTIENNSQMGVRVENGNDIPTIQNNTIRNNTGYVLSVGYNPLTSAVSKISGNTVTGNDLNRIEFRGGSLPASYTWVDFVQSLPVDVTGVITVPSGMTLTFNPGQKIAFGPGGGITSSDGVVQAQGTPEPNSPIVFTSNSATPSPGSWQGIYLYGDNNDASRFSYCQVRFATYGFILQDVSTPVLSNCTITSCSANGIYTYDSGGPGTTPIIKNCITSFNGGAGVGANGLGSATVTYSDAFANAGGNFVGFSPGTGSITTNPLFLGPEDLHLQAASPCINTGEPSPGTADDADGTRSDMGAFPLLGPGFTTIAPVSGLQGESNIPLAITGVNLTGASQIKFLLSGTPDANISVSGITVVDDAHVSATVNIAPGAAVGNRVVQVVSTRGTSRPSVGAVFTVTPLGASTLTWTGNSSTDWNTITNWDSGFVPRSTDNVIVPDGAPNYPVLTVNLQVNDLTLNGGGRLTINGQTVDITGNLTVTLNDTLGTGLIMTNSTDVVRVEGNATFTNANGSIAGSSEGNFTAGVLHLHRDFTEVESGTAPLTPRFASTGTEVVFDGTTVQTVFLVNSQPTTSRFENVVFNNPVEVTLGSNVFVSGDFNNAGRAVIPASRTLTINGVTAANAAGAVLEGSGTIAAPNGPFVNSGSLNPGVSPGILTVTGSFSQTSTGALNIEVGGVTAGSEFDQLNVSGDATLDGTLNVNLINSFSPAVSQAFEILSFATRSGDFATKNGLNLSGGLFIQPDFTANALTLTTLSASPSNVVTNTLDSGAGSLREAINFVNSLPASPTTITFDIPANDPGWNGLTFAIQPQSPLPAIAVNGAVIDGTTQPGFILIPLIEISGAAAGPVVDGLTFTGSDCVAKGLVMNDFSRNGILLQGVNGRVLGCGLGTDAAGNSSRPNGGNGIEIVADGAVIGGPAGDLVLVSGNRGNGLVVRNGATGVKIMNCYIGLNLSGTSALGNGGDGVRFLEGAHANVIGGTNPVVDGVTISGNTGDGIYIAGAGTDNNLIRSARIGGNHDDSSTIPNGRNGVTIEGGAAGNAVGDSPNALGNTIYGNGGHGVLISGSGTVSNTVRRSVIGTNPVGVSGFGNLGHGVLITGGASGNLIGGAGANDSNLISGNGNCGIRIDAANNNLVLRNRIGTDANGTSALGNAEDGVWVSGGAQGNMIGGSGAGEGNMISGNAHNGVHLSGAGTQGNQVMQNLIGVDATLIASLPNGFNGALIEEDAQQNVLGGAGPVGNRIAFNGMDGVRVLGANTLSNAILGNSLQDNGGLGIDLGGDGVTPNDPLDADASPNKLQNFPDLRRVQSNGSNTFVVGFLDSDPANSAYPIRVEFFANPVSDPSGFGEGKMFLGFTSESAPGTFTVASLPATNAGSVITATATDANGNSSEFSQAVSVGLPALSINDVSVVEGNLGTTAAVFTVSISVPSTQTVSVDFQTSNAPESAIAGEDYDSASGTLSFSPGTMSQPITITVRGDVIQEPDETFFVDLSNPTDAAIGDGQGVGTIVNDDTGVCTPPPSGMIHWWPGDNDPNDVLHGSFGNLENGAGFAPGLVAEAFSLDGVNNYVRVPHNTSLNPTGPFSVDAWIKGDPQQFSPFVHLVDKSHGFTDGTGWVLACVEGRGSFSFGKGGATGVQSNFVTVETPGNVLDGQWHHLAGVFTGSQAEIYLDGALSNAVAYGSPPVNNNRDLLIGAAWGGGPLQRFFHGLIDEVEYYSRALSGPEVQSLFSAGSGGKCKPTVYPPSPVVLNTSDSGPGSLREAINFANSHPNTAIVFNIPTNDPGYQTGFFIISPQTALPAITANGIMVDGNSQRSYTGDTNPAGPEVEVYGGGAVPEGFELRSDNCVVKGLVIKGFGNGVKISGSGVSNNVVEGCYIGTEATGTSAVGNTIGVLIDQGAQNNRVGGVTPEARNLISGNASVGVLITGSTSVSNVVQGNFIGTNSSGLAPLGNGGQGLFVDGASGNLIGGIASSERNVISGNGTDGIEIKGSTASGNRVLGNCIGLDGNGSNALANAGDGVKVSDAPNNTIGGAGPGEGNLISGNGSNGIQINGSGTSGNLVQGNLIGTDTNGTTAVANAGDGVLITLTASNNTIGGTAVGSGNTIAYNGADGVDIGSGTAGTGNAVLRNSIFSNTNLGIDIGPDGVTANDAGDADSGPNNLQNFPQLSSVHNDGSNTLVNGFLSGDPANVMFPVRIEFFGNPGDDPSEYGEGQNFLGFLDVSSPGTFTINSLPPAPVGHFVTATATDAGGNTSEFSHACPVLAGGGGPVGIAVTTTADSGPGSLREAIDMANETPGSTIVFKIPIAQAVGGVFTIQPTSPLPSIRANGTIIDGFSQIAFSGDTNPAGPEVVLCGASTGGNGLTLEAANGVVKGVVVNGFASGQGIDITGPAATGNRVLGCYIGTNADGTSSVGNGDGVRIVAGAKANIIGGTAAGARNVISGNADLGIVIADAGTDGNLIQGNLIGTSLSGDSAIPNTYGLKIIGGSQNNVIGGTTPGARNVISGNAIAGVIVSADNNVVQGNYIGADATGNAGLANGSEGLQLSGQNNTIGGPGGAGNVISGNQHGISIGGSNNSILGNRIGTNEAGTASLGNQQNGVSLGLGAANNSIGGPISGTGNVISGNSNAGVVIGGDTSTTGNLLQGNFIGTDATGTTAVGNGEGVRIGGGAQGNTVGGTASGERNVISGNLALGVIIRGGNGNSLQGNLIGTDGAGTGALANQGDGVLIDGGSQNNTIGGVVPGAGNVVANSAADGVRVTDANTTGNRIRANSIHDNAGLGIDLGGDGVTPNDPGDSDTGANDLMNSPVITTVNTSPSSTVVLGTLDSGAPGPIVVEVFLNDTPDASGFGEGQVFLGFTTVNGGAWTITTPPVPNGKLLSATATDANGNTSEFSASVTGFDQPDLMIRNSGEAPYLTDNTYEVTPTVQVRSQTVTPGVAAVYEIAAQNDGNQTHTYTLRGTGNGGGFDVQYFDDQTGGSDVTSLVTSTGLAMNLNAGEVRNVRVEVTPNVPPNAPPVGSFFDVFVDLVDGGAIDRVKATTSVGGGDRPDLMIRSQGESIFLIDNVYEVTPTVQVKSQTVTPGVAAVYEVAAQNDGNQTHTYTLKGTGNGGGFAVQYFDALTGGSDVTSLVTSTGLAMNLNAGEIRNLRVEVTPDGPPTAPPASSFFDVFVNLLDDGAVDRVKATTTVGNNEAPTVTGITPNSGLNSGVVNITDLSGTGFLTGATVKLLKIGQPDIAAGNVSVVNTTKITCDLDLTGATTGQWDVVVMNADTQSGVLSNGFTINGPPPTAVLRADYQLQNTLASSVGAPPPLAHLGGGNVFATETVDGAPHTVLQFPLGNGLTLSPTTGVIPSGVYTIVVLFRFDQVSNYRRIADFKNGFSDTGFYNLSSNLNFYNVVTGAGSPIQANTYVQAVLTRDATGQVAGYVDGVQQFAFQDSSNLAVIDANNTLRFFRDDTVTTGEHSGGAVARIRTFDGALTAGQVAALDRLGSGLPAVSIGDASVFEGNSGATIATFTVSLSVPSSNSVQVSYATVDESATLVDGDYVAASGSLTFSPGTVSQPVTVTVIGDAIQEPDETFRVDLANPVNATLARSQGIGTIRNDDINQCVPPPPGLIGWWPGEGNASDQTGGHNGTPEGGLSFAAGRVGQAFKFNGADSGVSLGSWFNLQSFSVAMWVNPGVSQVAFANIIDNNHRTNINWVVQQDGGNTNQYNWVPFDGGGGIPFSLRPNSWQYLVLTRDASNVNQVYLDGQLVGSTTGLGPIPYNGSQSLRLGHWGGGARHFNGLMDEVDVYNRPLIAAEVQALFQAGSAGKCPGADFLPPTVASSTADNAINSVKVTFSEDVNSSDAETLANFALESPIGNSVSITATSLSYDLVTKTTTISGTVLTAGNTYKVSVTNVRDLAGNMIVNNGTTNVSTGAVADVVPPTVVASSADKTSNSVTVTFSEEVNGGEATTVGNFALESPMGVPVSITGATLTYDSPSKTTTISGTSLVAGNSYKVTVINVRDTTGNTILNNGSTNVSTGTVAAPPPTSFDAVADFSAAANPNGAWSYGYSATRGSTFILDTLSQSQTNLDTWSGTSGGPHIAKNKSGVTLNYATIVHPLDVLNLDPSFDGRNAVVRWTAPSAGTFNVTGRFQGLDVGSTTTDVAVLKNSSTTLFSANINGFNATTPFSLNVTVAAGDQIDFSVGRGTGGSLNDSTGLAAAISPSASDVTPPMVVASTADNNPNSVTITFSEDVNATDATTAANVVLESPVGSSVPLTATTLSYNSGAKTTTISGTTLTAGNSYKITVTGVRDLAGNVIVNNGTTNVSTGAVADVVGPKVTGCQADNTQVVISFDEPLDPASVSDPSNYELRSPSSAVNPVDLTGKTPQLDATNRQVTIPALGLHNGDSFSVTVNNVRDAVGNTIAAPGNQCSGSVALTPGASLSELSGNSQTGTAGQPLQDPFIVQVTAPTATTPVPVPGVTVRFIVAEGGGAFVNGSTPATSTTVMTDANGEAQATLTLGPKVGTNRVTAAAPDLVGAAVTFTASGNAAGTFKVSLGATPNRTVQGGQSRVTAIVSDVNGNRTPDVPLQFAVIRGGGSLVGDSSTGTTVTATTNANGKAEVDLTNITYGSNKVQVSDSTAGTLSIARTQEPERTLGSELPDSAGRSVSRLANTEVIEILGEFAIHLTSGLNLIAVPFALDDTDPAAVFRTPANQLKVAGWNEGANSGRGDYVFYNGSNLAILPGRGFWVQHPDESDLNIARGIPVDVSQSFALPMNRGYELIGNPYPAGVPWNLADIHVRRGGVDQGDLRAAGLAGHLVEPYAWIWDAVRQGYDLVFDPQLIAEIPDPLRETMRAFLPVGAGGWFLSNADGVELVLSAPGNSQILRRSEPRIAPRKADNGHWGIELIASAGGGVRSASSPTCSAGNILGVIDSPLLGGQGLQVAKAPIAGALAGRGYVDLGFLGESGALLALDMRSTRQATRSTEGKVWRFQVTTNLTNAEVEITYPNLSLVPKQCRVFLTDEATGQKQALRTTSLYSFRSQPSGVTQRTFRLEITEEIASRLRVANLAVVSTGRSLLPGVRISYGLSQPAKVTLRVRSVTGGVVYEIPAADVRAGLNSAMWDGRNATGAFTPRGVYLVELIARNEQGEEVKAVRSVTVK